MQIQTTNEGSGNIMITNDTVRRPALFPPLHTVQTSKCRSEICRLQRPAPFLIALIIFSVALPLSTLAQASWQQVIDNEAGFKISFPGQPTYQATTDPTTGLQTEIYKFFYTGRLLRITFAPLSQSVRTPAEFSKAYSDFAHQVVPQGGVLLRQQKLPDGGRQYDTLTDVKDGTIYGRTRFYIRNGRYYAVAFEMYARGRIDERKAERFLTSFSFLDGLPKRRATTRNTLPMEHNARNSERAKWYFYRSPDNDFVVEFPGEPRYQFDQSPGKNPSFHRYQYFYGENIFQISYREEPRARTQPKEVIKRASESYTSSREGWQVLSQLEIAYGGYQIESQGIVDGARVYSRVRLYVRGTRIYYLTVLTPNLTGPNEDDVSRFFKSFRFL